MHLRHSTLLIGPALLGPITTIAIFYWTGHWLGKSLSLIAGCFAMILGIVCAMSGCKPSLMGRRCTLILVLFLLTAAMITMAHAPHP